MILNWLIVVSDFLDLFNLDIENGECRNQSIPQNVTFKEQGGFLDSSASFHHPSALWTAMMIAVAITFGVNFV